MNIACKMESGFAFSSLRMAFLKALSSFLFAKPVVEIGRISLSSKFRITSCLEKYTSERSMRG